MGIRRLRITAKVKTANISQPPLNLNIFYLLHVICDFPQLAMKLTKNSHLIIDDQLVYNQIHVI